MVTAGLRPPGSADTATMTLPPYRGSSARTEAVMTVRNRKRFMNTNIGLIIRLYLRRSSSNGVRLRPCLFHLTERQTGGTIKMTILLETSITCLNSVEFVRHTVAVIDDTVPGSDGLLCSEIISVTLLSSKRRSFTSATTTNPAFSFEMTF